MTDLREEMRRGFDRIDDRFAQIDARFGHFDARLLSLEQKVDRQFVWLVGIQLTTMLTVVGVLTAAVFRTPLNPLNPLNLLNPLNPLNPLNLLNPVNSGHQLRLCYTPRGFSVKTG